MLLDGQRRPRDVDLLHDAGEGAIAAQATATTGAGVEQMFLEARHLFRWKRLAFVLGMTGLAARRPRAGGVTGRRRLDDVRRRRFGGGRGILLGRRQLFLNVADLILQDSDPCPMLSNFRIALTTSFTAALGIQGV